MAHLEVSRNGAIDELMDVSHSIHFGAGSQKESAAGALQAILSAGWYILLNSRSVLQCTSRSRGLELTVFGYTGKIT